MTVYSIEWNIGRDVFRMWFATEAEARLWKRERNSAKLVGPIKHEVDGPHGLVSFLREYVR